MRACEGVHLIVANREEFFALTHAGSPLSGRPRCFVTYGPYSYLMYRLNGGAFRNEAENASRDLCRVNRADR